jgi:hypothetical protein
MRFEKPLVTERARGGGHNKNENTSSSYQVLGFDGKGQLDYSHDH